jgi:lipid-A-disaccharide synthase
MADRLSLFILAGEASGDRIGADLVTRLRSRVALDIKGVGGDELTAVGLSTIFPMRDLSVMGLSDVLRRLPLLLWRIEQTARAIRKMRPDIAVLIDSQDFSNLVARRLRAIGYAGKLILYVSPSVWARHPERAPKLKRLFDEVLAVLPFEPAVMQRLGGPPTSYVGHPALAERLEGDGYRERGTLILLPGSREGELRRHLPAFRTVVESLAGHAAIEEIVVPTLPSLAERIRAEIATWPVPVKVVAERRERAALYGRAIAALAVSGTATLELALARVPMVVCYVMDSHQAPAYERYGRPVISLPSIILGRPIVPEFVQAPADASVLAAALRELLDNKKARQSQIEAFGELSNLMETGEAEFPREDPADRILRHWQGNQRLASPT